MDKKPPNKFVFKPYNALFPSLFAEEQKRLASHLPSLVLIEHVGSTAVPGLGGKGIIDIAIAAPAHAWETIKVQLEKLAYKFHPAFSTESRLYFVAYLPDPEEEIRRYHIHLTHEGSTDWQGLLGFRDHLRSHPEEAREYANIKERAVLEAKGDGSIYRDLKNPFLTKNLDRVKSRTE